MSAPAATENMVPAWKVAEVVDVSTSTILRWADQGKLRSYRPKHSIRPVRFLMSEVLDDLRGDHDGHDGAS